MLVFDGNRLDDLGSFDAQFFQVGAAGKRKSVSFRVVRECMRGSDGGACGVNNNKGLRGLSIEAWEGVGLGHGSERSWGWCSYGSEQMIIRKLPRTFRAYWLRPWGNNLPTQLHLPVNFEGFI